MYGIATDGTIVVSCREDNKIVGMWNMDLELEQSLEGHTSGVYGAVGVFSVDISPDSTMIVSGDEIGEVKVWKKGGEGRWACVKTWNDNTGEEAVAVIFSPNGEMLATGLGDRKINVYSVFDDLSLIHTMEGHTSSVYLAPIKI